MSILVRPDGDALAIALGHKYMSWEEMIRLQVGQQMDVLCSGGVHRVGKLCSFNNSFQARVHLVGSDAGNDYIGSLLRLYLAKEGQFSSSARNAELLRQQIERTDTEMMATTHKRKLSGGVVTVVPSAKKQQHAQATSTTTSTTSTNRKHSYMINLTTPQTTTSNILVLPEITTELIAHYRSQIRATTNNTTNLSDEDVVQIIRSVKIIEHRMVHPPTPKINIVPSQYTSKNNGIAAYCSNRRQIGIWYKVYHDMHIDLGNPQSDNSMSSLTGFFVPLHKIIHGILHTTSTGSTQGRGSEHLDVLWERGYGCEENMEVLDGDTYWGSASTTLPHLCLHTPDKEFGLAFVKTNSLQDWHTRVYKNNTGRGSRDIAADEVVFVALSGICTNSDAYVVTYMKRSELVVYKDVEGSGVTASDVSSSSSGGGSGTTTAAPSRCTNRSITSSNSSSSTIVVKIGGATHNTGSAALSTCSNTLVHTANTTMTNTTAASNSATINATNNKSITNNTTNNKTTTNRITNPHHTNTNTLQIHTQVVGGSGGNNRSVVQGSRIHTATTSSNDSTLLQSAYCSLHNGVAVYWTQRKQYGIWYKRLQDLRTDLCNYRRDVNVPFCGAMKETMGYFAPLCVFIPHGGDTKFRISVNTTMKRTKVWRNIEYNVEVVDRSDTTLMETNADVTALCEARKDTTRPYLCLDITNKMYGLMFINKKSMYTWCNTMIQSKMTQNEVSDPPVDEVMFISLSIIQTKRDSFAFNLVKKKDLVVFMDAGSSGMGVNASAVSAIYSGSSGGNPTSTDGDGLGNGSSNHISGGNNSPDVVIDLSGDDEDVSSAVNAITADAPTIIPASQPHTTAITLASEGESMVVCANSAMEMEVVVDGSTSSDDILIDHTSNDISTNTTSALTDTTNTITATNNSLDTTTSNPVAATTTIPSTINTNTATNTNTSPFTTTITINDVLLYYQQLARTPEAEIARRNLNVGAFQALLAAQTKLAAALKHLLEQGGNE